MASGISMKGGLLSYQKEAWRDYGENDESVGDIYIFLVYDPKEYVDFEITVIDTTMTLRKTPELSKAGTKALLTFHKGISLEDKKEEFFVGAFESIKCIEPVDNNDRGQ